MSATPQSPAYTPTFASTPVRGAKRIFRGGGIGEIPPFSWHGAVNIANSWPGYATASPLLLVEAAVTMRVSPTAIVFNILFDEVVVETVNASALYFERYSIGVPTTGINTVVTIDLTNIGDGLMETLTIQLRTLTTPSP